MWEVGQVRKADFMVIGGGKSEGRGYTERRKVLTMIGGGIMQGEELHKWEEY